MEQQLIDYILNFPLWTIVVVIIAGFFVLIRSAETLVNKTVILSLHWNIPRIVISSTIISLGTTLPELSVSAVASLHGDPGLALGNAVGSVITDSTLILGISALIAPVVIDHKILKVQGTIQLITTLLLIGFSILFLKNKKPFIEGGHLPQFIGVLFVGLLLCYIIYSLSSGKNKTPPLQTKNILQDQPIRKSITIITQLILCIVLIITSSTILVPTFAELAGRFKIPQSIIGATLVAFGTSLPELTTAITSSRKGYSDIAVGNIIGADILNILFVIGFSLALTPKGFEVTPPFYKLYFPAMLLSVITFQCAAYSKRSHALGPKLGTTLILIYTITTILGYFL